MDFTGFSAEDFAVFDLAGFEERMLAIRSLIRPKLLALGEILAPGLSAKSRHSFYPHVASHARRTVNPPDDTWLALGRSPRGYKMYVHYAVGIARDYVYTRLVLKPEAKDKETLARNLQENGPQLLNSFKGKNIFWYGLPKKLGTTVPIEDMDNILGQVVEDLQQKKSSWLAVGRELKPNNPLLQQPANLVPEIENFFLQLLPLYRAAAEKK
ncbi:DUF1054 family protein [Bacillota bacterium LX-D]|nr:DUF1054 family protein [Bacillota bacterium LX-D]